MHPTSEHKPGPTFNSMTDHPDKKKINKETLDLNYTLDQTDLTDIKEHSIQQNRIHILLKFTWSS